MQRKVIFVSCCLILCSCKRSTYGSDPFVVDEKEISPQVLEGVWMADEASVIKMREKLRYTKYIKATENVLRLNKDGSCVYTGSSLYSSNCFMFNQQDEENDMRNYYNNPSPKLTENYCWYESVKAFPFVVGPYLRTNGLPNAHTRIFEKSMWSRWRICKRQTKIDFGDFTQPHDWDYKIELLPVVDDNIRGASVNMYFGKDQFGIYLFVPIVTDDGPIRDCVRFRKRGESLPE